MMGSVAVRHVKWTKLVEIALAAIALAAIMMAVPAAAQDTNTPTQDSRVSTLEAEVHALQQQAFPGASGTTSTATSSALPTATPMTDMLTRMDALETQVQHLTSQNEEMNNRLHQLDSKIKALVPPPIDTSVASASAATAKLTTPVVSADEGRSNLVTSNAKPPESQVSASRIKSIKAVAKPQTNDPIEDSYTYAFNLWKAKLYPQAEQQLQFFLKKYPESSRATYARNLMGRAYFDDNQPRLAAQWFLKNYETDKQGARAPDSMFYLARSMVALKDDNRACIALDQFAQSYATEAAGRLKGDYDKLRKSVHCNG